MQEELRVLLIQLFVTLNVETISFRVYEAHDPKAEKYSRFYDVITLDDFNDVSIIMDSTTENELAVEAVVTFKHEMFKAYNICRTYMGCDSEHIIKEIIGLIADYQFKIELKTIDNEHNNNFLQMILECIYCPRLMTHYASCLYYAIEKF